MLQKKDEKQKQTRTPTDWVYLRNDFRQLLSHWKIKQIKKMP